jgi:hypothetical protein
MIPWDLEHFKQLPSFRARVEYATKQLGSKLGAGSARVVFPVKDDSSGDGGISVLKLAKNKKGLAQNEVEAEISDLSSGYSEIIAMVKAYDQENYFWLEVERADKITKADFRKLTGFDFDTFGSVLINEISKRPTMSVDPGLAREIYDSPLLEKMVSFIRDFGQQPGDLDRLSSWGKVTRNGRQFAVLVDYGLSREVFQQHYKK